jgi:hypothetical protein
MNTRVFLCVAVCILSSCIVYAVSEDAASSDLVVRDKVDRDERGISPETGLRREAARRAEAEKKVETLRNIPPERVQDWINGKLSEAQLEKLAAETRGKPTSVAEPVPRLKVNRFLLLSLATLVLAFFYSAQRRRARMEAAQKKPWKH